MRGCGALSLVLLVLVAVLVAAGVWAGQKLWQAGEDVLFSLGDTETSAPVAEAAPIAVEAPDSVGAVQEPETGWMTDKGRRVAFSTATVADRNLAGVDADTTYNEVAALCSALDAGATPVPTVAAFVDAHSSAVTAAPMAKVTAAGMAIHCPGHYTTTLEAVQMMAPDLQLPEEPSFEWVP